MSEKKKTRKESCGTTTNCDAGLDDDQNKKIYERTI